LSVLRVKGWGETRESPRPLVWVRKPGGSQSARGAARAPGIIMGRPPIIPGIIMPPASGSIIRARALLPLDCSDPNCFRLV